MGITADNIFVQETATLFGGNKDIGVYAQICVLNNMAAKGAIPVSMGAIVFYGEEKTKVYPIKNRMLKADLPYRLQEPQIMVRRIPECVKPWVQVHGTGMLEKETYAKEEIKPAFEIVQVGDIGKDGTIRIVQEKKGDLLKRFTPTFLGQMKDWDKELLVQQEILEGQRAGASSIRHVGEQGITQALWKLAQEHQIGILVDIKKILIRQETIEICEQYRMNPYRVSSIGCVLMISEDGSALARELCEKGFQASVIGRFCESHDKMFQNGEERSYIESQSSDEMLKLFY